MCEKNTYFLVWFFMFDVPNITKNLAVVCVYILYSVRFYGFEIQFRTITTRFEENDLHFTCCELYCCSTYNGDAYILHARDGGGGIHFNILVLSLFASVVFLQRPSKCQNGRVIPVVKFGRKKKNTEEERDISREKEAGIMLRWGGGGKVQRQRVGRVKGRVQGCALRNWRRRWRFGGIRET